MSAAEMTALSRAAARILLDDRQSKESPMMRKFRELLKAADKENVAGAPGPANELVTKYWAMLSALGEVHGEEPSRLRQLLIGRSPRCYYCGKPSTPGRLCDACWSYFRSVAAGRDRGPDPYRRGAA